jgi:hypothetical protein
MDENQRLFETQVLNTEMDENSNIWKLENICCYCGERGHNNLNYQCQFYIDDRLDNEEYILEMEDYYGPYWYVNIGPPHSSYDVVQYLQEEYDRYMDISSKAEEEKKKIADSKYITIQEIAEQYFVTNVEINWFF